MIRTRTILPTWREAPDIALHDGRYALRFARTDCELDEALHLRFNVFNLELGEGLSESYLTGRDRDRFDDVCHHMIVLDTESNAIVGTYRLQAAENANHGWYSSSEFALNELPAHVHAEAVELGRACIHKEHRTPAVLFLLWAGIAAYMCALDKRYLFGCCSLTSQDPREGKRVMEQLEAQGALHPQFCIRPQPGCACYEDGFAVNEALEVRIPKLFRAYLRFGAKVCGAPAIDREFQTIDYFVLFDREDKTAEARRFFVR
jgi:putative hemolysin